MFVVGIIILNRCCAYILLLIIPFFILNQNKELIKITTKAKHRKEWKPSVKLN